MGKLGGQELNYSSDVDVVFVYAEDMELKRGLTTHDFFKRLGEEIINAVGQPSAEGSIFRIDLRLRPEGASGPLVRSLESFENYYAQWGETWERMALIKARCVAGDAALGAEFIEMVQPFVYPRHAGERVIQQMAAIKQRIEREIVREERLTRHVKLGIGGIREIEFIVQSFQVLRGAREPVFRDRSTLRALTLLATHRVLTDADAWALAEAYRFLRNVEHRLQMEMELQTHTIPDEEHAQFRLARSLGFATVKNFQAAQNVHTSAVRKIYNAVLAGAAERVAQRDEQLLSPEKLPAALATAGFADVPAALKIVERLLHGPGFGHVSDRSKELFAQIFPALLGQAMKVADPDAALARFEKIVTAYGARGLLYEMFASHPRLVELLVRVADASRYFSDTLAQQPNLFEEVCRGVRLAESKELERMWDELNAEVGRRKMKDGEAGMDAAREWKRGELLRIGIEDVMGLADLEHVHQELTWLAEACVRFVVDETRRGDPPESPSSSPRRARGEGQPRGVAPAKFPFAIIGMGKFGGQEMGYGADLDVLFVGGKGAKDLEQAIKVATRVMNLMERQTPAGTMFRVDPRLRPDGEKGPLASSLEAHRDYYRQRALTWERQALTKARVVAGDARLGAKFIEMVHEIVYSRGLSAAELAEIKQMRRRIETERADRTRPELEFKTGAGGLVDVEFLVQTLQLRHGHAHPQLRTAHTLAALNRLTALGIVDDEASYQLRRGYLFLRRIESVLRRMDNVSVSKLPASPTEMDLLAKRLGFASATDFLGSYQLATGSVRQIYDEMMR